MLIKHLRDAAGVPFATVVAIGRGSVGVSICCPKDRFNKKRGVEIAQGRAEKNHCVDIPKRKVEQSFTCRQQNLNNYPDTMITAARQVHVDDIIECEVIRMAHRSQLYYKE